MSSCGTKHGHANVCPRQKTPPTTKQFILRASPSCPATTQGQQKPMQQRFQEVLGGQHALFRIRGCRHFSFSEFSRYTIVPRRIFSRYTSFQQPQWPFTLSFSPSLPFLPYSPACVSCNASRMLQRPSDEKQEGATNIECVPRDNAQNLRS
mmetsp:Transcript_50275/g.99002  ORF Transcript_50275/g.99002 Transcript_50275/m.99002 type:complete len:151 (-) Transcript_50275:122-574(-)